MSEAIRFTLTGASAVGIITTENSLPPVHDPLPLITGFTPPMPQGGLSFTILGSLFKFAGRSPINANIDGMNVVLGAVTDTTIAATAPMFSPYPHTGTLTVNFSDGESATHSITLPSGLSSFDTQVLNRNPIGYWRGEDAGPTVVSDLSSFNNPGTAQTGVTFGNASLLPSGEGKSLGLTGSGSSSNGTVIIPAASQYDLGFQTGAIIAWVNSAQNLSVILRRLTGSPSNGYLLYYFSKVAGRLWSAGSQLAVNGGTTLTNGTTYFFVFTWINGVPSPGLMTMEVYLNGTLDGTLVTNPAPGVTTGQNIVLGDDSLGSGANAKVQKVGLFNTHLLQADVTALWNARNG